MEFLNTYNSFKLINEGIQEVVDLYKNDTKLYKLLTGDNNRILNRVIGLDPTSNIGKNIAGKYSKWLIRQLKTDDRFIKKIINIKSGEDDYKIREVLEMFNTKAINKRLKYKDIFKYETFEELNTELDKFRFKTDDISDDNNETIDEIKKDVKKGTLEVFANLKKYLIVIPKVKETAVKYGKNTSWCTAEEKDNAFDSYRKENLYIFLDKKNSLKPTYQFYFETSMFMDKNDNPISINTFFDDNEDVYIKFFPDTLEKINNGEKLSKEVLRYIPTKYFNKIMGDKGSEFVNLLFRLISDITEIKSSAMTDLENNIKFFGIEESRKYTYDIRPDGADIIGMDFNYIEELIGIEHGVLQYINDRSTGGGESNNEDSWDSEESKETLNSYSNSKSVELLTRIFEELKLKYNTEETLSENLLELNIFDDVFDDFAYEYNNQNDIAIRSRAEELWKNTFFYQDHRYSSNKSSLGFNYLDSYKYIISNNLENINSFNDLLINFGDIDKDDYTYYFEYNISIAHQPITEVVNKKLDEIYEDIHLLGESGEYVKKIENFLEIKKELEKFKLKLGDDYENDLVSVNITADIGDDKDDARLIVKGKNKKTNKPIYHRIKPADLSAYLLNYKLDL